MTGRILLLNGPSSAGKTSLSQAVADLLPIPWHVLPVDLVHAVRSRPDLRGITGTDWESVFRTSRAGYHRMVAGLAQAGADVIADHVLSEPWRLADLLAVTSGLDVLLVHVTCDPSVLAEREAGRGDRDPGTALAQLSQVFVHDDCDLVVDTTSTPVAAAAGLVVALLADPPRTRAFDRLRRT